MDDVITSSDDTYSVTEGGELTASGNVTDNDTVGADGLDRVEWTGLAADSVYELDGASVKLNGEEIGTLSTDAEGNFTFTLNSGYDVPAAGLADLVVGYTAYDRDGDASDAKLTISINPDTRTPEVVVPPAEEPTDPTNPGLTEDSQTVSEANRPDGSRNATGENEAKTEGTIRVDAKGEAGTLTINGDTEHQIQLDAEGNYTGDPVSIKTEYGTLTITGVSNGEAKYTYELTQTPDVPGTEVRDDISIQLEDATHDVASGTLTITIVDDVPTAIDDSAVLAEADGSLSGNVVDNDVFGADTPDAKTVEWNVSGDVTKNEDGSLTVKTEYGEVLLKADGSYEYKLTSDVPNGKTVTDTFKYTITDSDGDTANATLTISTNGDSKVPTVEPGSGNAQIIVDEGAMPDGSGQHTEHGITGSQSLLVELNDESGTIDFGGIRIAVTDTTKAEWDVAQTVTVNGVEVKVTDVAYSETTGKWTVEYDYTLTDAQHHGNPDASGEQDITSGSFTVKVTDATGDTADMNVTVDVHDDAPVLSATGPVQGDSTVVDSNAFEHTGKYTFGVETGGADGNVIYTLIDGVKDAEGIVGTGEGSKLTIGTAIVRFDEDRETIVSFDRTEDALFNDPYSNGSQFTEGVTGSDGNWHGYYEGGSIGITGSEADKNLPGKNSEGRQNEVGYNYDTNMSEAIVLDLHGKTAYGLNVQLESFFQGAGTAESVERVLFQFFLDGEKVGDVYLRSDEVSGSVDTSITAFKGMFDEVYIIPVHNGDVEFGAQLDNSDFYLKSFEFLTPDDIVLASYTGTVSAKSADGIESIRFADIPDIETTNGTITFSVNESGDKITGTRDGQLVFEATLDGNGNWTSSQYATFDRQDGGEGITLEFVAKDNDGDTGNITVDVPFTTPSAPDSGSLTVDEKGLGNDADTSETGNWSVPDGYVLSGIKAQGEHGTATITKDGKLEYTLNEALTVEGDGRNTVENADTVTVILKDSSGNLHEVQVNVNVVDDVPVLGFDKETDAIHRFESSEGTFVMNYGADGALNGSETIDVRIGLPDGTTAPGTLTFENGMATLDVPNGHLGQHAGTLTVTDNGDGTYAYSFKAGLLAKSGDYTFNFSVTDGDRDTASDALTVTVENRVPIAEDDTFYINREDHFQSDISVKLGSSVITVKGSVLGSGDFNATDGLPEKHNTLEYGFSRNPVSGSTVKNEALISEPGSNFFSRFFKDETGNGLTEDALESGDEILTLRLDPNMTPSEMYEAVTAAAAEALKNGNILYITSSNTDTPLALHFTENMKFGDATHRQVVIVNGDLKCDADMMVDGFLYVDGNVVQTGDLTVNGGMAVSGNLTTAGAIDSSWTADAEGVIADEVIGTAHGDIVLSFADILSGKYSEGGDKPDHDPDGEGSGVSIDPSTIKLAAGMEGHYTLTVDADAGTVTLTPEDEKYEVKPQFTYQVRDADGALSNEATVSVEVNHMIVSTGGDPIYGGTSHDIIISNVDSTTSLELGSTNYNVAIILDMSGSMNKNMSGGDTTWIERSYGGGYWTNGQSRFDVAKDALKVLAEQLAGHDGKVNVTLITFSGDSKIENVDLDTINNDPEALKGILDGLPTPSGGTNYEAGLNMATKWLTEQNNNGCNATTGYENSVFFLTDGKPTYYVKDIFADATSRQTIHIPRQSGEWTENGYTFEVVKGASSRQWIVKCNGEEIDTIYGSSSRPTGEYAVSGVIEIPEGSVDGTTWIENGITYTLKSTDSTSGTTYPNGELHLFSGTIDLGSVRGGNGSATTNIETGQAENAYDHLRNTVPGGATVNTIGMGNIGTDFKPNLDAIDSNHDAQLVQTADELKAALDEGINQTFVSIPVPDTVYGNQGNDIIFGDTVGTLASVIAEKMGVGVEEVDHSTMINYIVNHPDEFDTSRTEYTYADGTKIVFDKGDILIGGEGNDYLYGQGGDDLLFGDGDNLPPKDGTGILDMMVKELGVTDTNSETLPASLVEAIHGLNEDQLKGLASKLEANYEKQTDGNDHLYGGEGDDVLIGGGGNDQLFGGAGDDLLFGGSGSDRLFGGEGDDVIFGGSGDDYLDGGAGSDKLYGGSGNDIIKYDASDFLVDGGEDIDFLVGDGATAAVDSGTVSNVEVFVDTNLPLTSMDDLAQTLGITLSEGGKVAFADSWTQGSETTVNNIEYVTYTHDGADGADATVMVQKAILEHAQG